MELDIWIPSFNLAFEFQGLYLQSLMLLGIHHYRESFNKALSVQRARDSSKKDACNSRGITLIEIPYWWDGKEGKVVLLVTPLESLLATVLHHRPDLLPHAQNKQR